MSADRLAIPLSTNPARQKLWRAVGFFGLLLGAILLGYLIDRAIHYRSSPQRWPAEANLELRLIKTPRIVGLVEEGLAGVQVLPGTPWDTGEALQWSKRELVVYTNDQAVVGLVIDGDLPEDVRTGLSNWGWRTEAVGHRTLILKTDSPEPLPLARHLNLWLTLPIFDGTATLRDDAGDKTGLPFRFSSASSLDFPIHMGDFVPQATLSLPADTHLTGSVGLPAELISAFLPETVPANFPGLQLLSEQAGEGGASLLLGNDEQGSAFVLALPATHLTLEELGAIATEGASLQALSTTALTSEGLPTSTEIRSSDKIDVNVSNSDGLEVATAETASHELFRLTQSDAQLIVSNRNPIIGLDSATYSGSCLRHPVGFIEPRALANGVPGFQQVAGQGVFNILLQANEVAYRKNWLRICW